jgi:hypothetical protein
MGFCCIIFIVVPHKREIQTYSSCHVQNPHVCYLSYSSVLSHFLLFPLLPTATVSSCFSIWLLSENSRQQNWHWTLEVVDFINKNTSWFKGGLYRSYCSIRICVCLSLYLFIQLSVSLCVYLSVYLYILSVCLSTCRPIHIPATCPSISFLPGLFLCPWTPRLMLRNLALTLTASRSVQSHKFARRIFKFLHRTLFGTKYIQNLEFWRRE